MKEQLINDDVFINHGWKSFGVPEYKKKNGISKFFQKRINYYDINLDNKTEDDLFINAWYYDYSILGYNESGFKPTWYFETQLETHSDRTVNIETVSWRKKDGQTDDEFIEEVENYFIKLYNFLVNDKEE